MEDWKPVDGELVTVARRGWRMGTYRASVSASGEVAMVDGQRFLASRGWVRWDTPAETNHGIRMSWSLEAPTELEVLRVKCEEADLSRQASEAREVLQHTKWDKVSDSVVLRVLGRLYEG